MSTDTRGVAADATDDLGSLRAAARVLAHHHADQTADPRRLGPHTIDRVYHAALRHASRTVAPRDDPAAAVSAWARWYACGALAQIITGHHSRYCTRIRTGNRAHSPHTDACRLLHCIAAEAAGLHRSLILIATEVSEQVYVETLNRYAAEHGLPVHLRVRPPLLASCT